MADIIIITVVIQPVLNYLVYQFRMRHGAHVSPVHTEVVISSFSLPPSLPNSTYIQSTSQGTKNHEHSIKEPSDDHDAQHFC